jgi:hypothetical protein
MEHTEQFAAPWLASSCCKPTKTVRKKKRVALDRHGRTIHVTKTITQHLALALAIPTSITAQSGAVLTQTTKVVTGCPKATASKHKKAHGAKARRRR